MPRSPASTAGALHSEIRARATVLSEFFTEEGCLMELQASPAVLGRLIATGARRALPEDRPTEIEERPTDSADDPRKGEKTPPPNRCNG